MDGWDGSPGGPRYRAPTVLIMMIMMIPRDQDDHYDLWEIRVCP